MRVLVVHASAHGSTAEIGSRVAESLAKSGPDVDVRAVVDVASLAGYDATILGSAVHDGAWLPEAHEFLREHKATMAKRPTWLFSVGTVGATSSAYGSWGTAVQRRMRRDPRAIYEARAALGHVDHRYFAGVVTPEDWTGHAGRIDGSMLEGLGPMTTAFVCGSNGFVEAATRLLLAAGVDPARIRTERFGPTS